MRHTAWRSSRSSSGAGGRGRRCCGRCSTPIPTWRSPTRCRSSSATPGPTTRSATAGRAASTPRRCTDLILADASFRRWGIRRRTRGAALSDAAARVASPTRSAGSTRRRRHVRGKPRYADKTPMHVLHLRPAGPAVPRGPLRPPDPRRARRRRCPTASVRLGPATVEDAARRVAPACVRAVVGPGARLGARPLPRGPLRAARRRPRAGPARPVPVPRPAAGTTPCCATTSGPLTVIARTRFPAPTSRLLLPPTPGLRDWRREMDRGRRRPLRGHRRPAARRAGLRTRRHAAARPPAGPGPGRGRVATVARRVADCRRSPARACAGRQVGGEPVEPRGGPWRLAAPYEPRRRAGGARRCWTRRSGWVPDEQHAGFFALEAPREPVRPVPGLGGGRRRPRSSGSARSCAGSSSSTGGSSGRCGAVDTATHPDHQGRGIFSALTRHALDELRDDGVGVRVQHAQRPEPARLPEDGLAGRSAGCRSRPGHGPLGALGRLARARTAAGQVVGADAPPAVPAADALADRAAGRASCWRPPARPTASRTHRTPPTWPGATGSRRSATGRRHAGRRGDGGLVVFRLRRRGAGRGGRGLRGAGPREAIGS